MRTRSVVLTERQADLIETLVESGRTPGAMTIPAGSDLFESESDGGQTDW
jgi:hypothetical protein